MANFIYGTELNLAIESMIEEANEFLWFISPYIKLHDRIRDELKRKKDKHELEIVIVFGKNEEDLKKSISIEDIDFLKEFPNVEICYEKNLHAKYYASEDFSLITSMNLHQFSQNTNVEVGIIMQPKDAIKKLANIALSNSDAGEDAMKYFDGIIEHSETIFKKVPEYDNGIFGFNKKYKNSKIEIDKLDSFFSAAKSDYKTSRTNSFNQYNKSQTQQQSYASSQPQMGYCIRTGVQIPFNPTRPYSYEAYQSWAKFENFDYAEKFCHLTGKPSYGKTSMGNPIL